MSSFHPPPRPAAKCDGMSNCDAPCVLACRCDRCRRDRQADPGEGFYACKDHQALASEKHERVRGRCAYWAAWGF